MKYFNKLTGLFAKALHILLIIALALLGILLLLMLFKELIPIAQSLLAADAFRHSTKILDEIIVFFLVFEFSFMVISALQHKGHTSINFLMSLGVTALLRGLITAHGNIDETIANAVAILLLIIGMVIFNKFLKGI